jgi:hypothetical protein
MTRFPRKFPKIRRVQLAERMIPLGTQPVAGYQAIPGHHYLHPEVNQEFFDERKSTAQEQLRGRLRSQDWFKIRFEPKPSGVVVVYGQCVSNSAALEGAKKGLYGLFLEPPLG